jgi:hypothetical protein
MRYTLISSVLLALTVAFGGCQADEKTYPVTMPRIETQRVEAALARWPAATTNAIKRPFFATIHIAGRRTTASGVLEYHGPLDFRLTAATEMGVVLFDGRVNWAGVTVLRSMPGLERSLVEILLKDMSRAFDLPPSLEGISISPRKLTLEKTLADTHRYTWTFDPDTGQLRSTSVDLGLLDTLTVDYRSYNARGWPEDVLITRKARFLEVAFTFTDNNVMQVELPRNNRGGAVQQ